MSKDPMHTTVCDHCWRGTWFETEGQECRFSVSTYCDCCHQRTGEKRCPGKLRLIDRSHLAPQFAKYYESGERIKVRFSHGEELTGTVGKTSGWRPSYLLMRRADSIGSPYLLGHADEIIAVKQENGRYRPTLRVWA